MYDELLQAVTVWLAAAQRNYAGIITFEANETPHGLIVNLETDRHIAQLSLSPPEFRPYRYAEFLVLDAEQDLMQPPVYVFRDGDGDSVSDVIAGLDAGMRFIGGEGRPHAD